MLISCAIYLYKKLNHFLRVISLQSKVFIYLIAFLWAHFVCSKRKCILLLMLISCLQNNDLLREMREIDTQVVEELSLILKPFKDCTMVMSTESSSSVSLIRPLLKKLMCHCRDGNTSVASLHELKETIYNDLDKR